MTSIQFIFLLAMAAVSTACRRSSVVVIVLVSSLMFGVLATWLFIGLSEPHSRWSAIPVAGVPIAATFFIASRHFLRDRPIAAFVVSLATGVVAMFIGLVIATELGLARS